MVIVEAGVDARPKDVLEQVPCVVKGVRMNPIAEHAAFEDNVHLSCAEITWDEAGQWDSDTTVCGWILRMAGRYPQRSPIGICDQIRITPANPNRGYRAPEVIRELGIPTTDSRIRSAGPKDAHHPGRLHNVQIVAADQVVEGAGILPPRVISPKQPDFRLRRRTNRAVYFAQGTSQIVIVDPFLASDRLWSVRKKLRVTGHSERAHLREPRRRGRTEFWRRGLPSARSTPGGIRNVGFEAVARSLGDQGGSRGFTYSDAGGLRSGAPAKLAQRGHKLRLKFGSLALTVSDHDAVCRSDAGTCLGTAPP